MTTIHPLIEAMAIKAVFLAEIGYSEAELVEEMGLHLRALDKLSAQTIREVRNAIARLPQAPEEPLVDVEANGMVLSDGLPAIETGLVAALTAMAALDACLEGILGQGESFDG